MRCKSNHARCISRSSNRNELQEASITQASLKQSSSIAQASLTARHPIAIRNNAMLKIPDHPTTASTQKPDLSLLCPSLLLAHTLRHPRILFSVKLPAAQRLLHFAGVATQLSLVLVLSMPPLAAREELSNDAEVCAEFPQCLRHA